MDWQPMKSAPADRSVEIKTAGGRKFFAHIEDGFLDGGENDVCGWVADDEDAAPPCWTGGVCWETNEEGLRSDWPVAWRERSDAA